jgi:hypothetical protein
MNGKIFPKPELGTNRSLHLESSYETESRMGPVQ